MLLSRVTVRPRGVQQAGEGSITPRLTETRHSVLGQQLGLVVHVRDEVVDVVAMRLHGAEVRLH